MHALLFRKWKDRVKGRDWYDLEWYVKKGVSVNLAHLAERARESGDWTEPTLTKEQLKGMLADRIDSLVMARAKEDVIRFIPNPQELDIWSSEYFRQLVGFLKVE
jgi:hypothetical protein